MGWRLDIEHVTEYAYAGEVLASYNEARITPRPGSGQVVLDHRVAVEPSAPVLHYVDYWGSAVCAFDVHRAHERLLVTGRSLVETPDVHTCEPVGARFHEFLGASACAPIDDNIRAMAEHLTGPDPHATIDAVLAWIREHLVYEFGTTDVTTTASEAIALGRGVCQDFVHVALALLRAAAIPARYVSGYLHPHADGAIGETVIGQSHAWIEAWVGEWRAFDPTNGAEVGPRHVLVARGRDYRDVVPLKGVFHGPPNATVAVQVAITRVA